MIEEKFSEEMLVGQRGFMQNRELSWLQFNRRVMEEALDETVPLFERLKFISIFQSNLDEFFMVRVGSIDDLSVIEPDERDNKSLMAPEEQLEAIFATVKPLIKEQTKIYNKVMKQLGKYGIEEVDFEALTKKERKFARDYYRDFVLPVLSPQVIDDRHPFPHLKNKELYVAMLLTEESGTKHLGIVPIPENMPDLLFDPEAPLHFVRLENLVLQNVSKLFSIYEVSDPCIISVTRNADINMDDDRFADTESDYRTHVSRLLKRRTRLNPVRLEIEGNPTEELINALTSRLSLTRQQVFTSSVPLNLGWAFALEDKLAPELKAEITYPPFAPRASKVFEEDRPIAEQVIERDRLLFYPYDSIDPFLRMLREAAIDPDVVTIKITVYRLAKNSRVGQYLCEAAENGKDVTVLMELRARFDEAHNIDWSRRLEEAGCHIIYGMDFYKCHSKLCLISRQVNGKVINISQIGTGNYNEKTARLYTDLCLFTANEEIGHDAVNFFQNMLIGNLNGAYEHLLVAPSNMKRTLLALADKEIAKGTAGRITIKANSLTDRDVIEKLKEASCAGVQVKLNIRSICCLVPGIKGQTENIHIRSIVGQFLEHSRIYCFGTGESREVYIASADLMTRNLVHRVEVACHIFDPEIKQSIYTFLDKIFADNYKARELGTDGFYHKIERAEDEKPFVAQDWFVANPLQIIHEAKPAVKQGFFAKLKALFSRS